MEAEQRTRQRGHKLLILSVALIVVSVAALIPLGVEYWHEADYWLVGIPGFGTAIGTIGLAGATFRLIQREGQDRENTRIALGHSQIMADEAARHRRDDRARLLRIATWGPIRAFPEGKTVEHFKDGETFDMPADAHRKVRLIQVLSVNSLDGMPIHTLPNSLYVDGELTFGIQPVEFPRPSRIGRAPRNGNDAWFAVERTVAEWAAIAESRESGDAGDEAVATIGVDDSFDDGVFDTYTIVQAGCPLRRSPERHGQWILDLSPESNGMPRVVVVVRPMERRYYVSKIRNEPLVPAL